MSANPSIKEIVERYLEIQDELNVGMTLEEIITDFIEGREFQVLINDESGERCSCGGPGCELLPCGAASPEYCVAGYLKKCVPVKGECDHCEDPEPGTMSCASLDEPEPEVQS